MNDKISTESVEPEPCFACDLPTVLMKQRWENTPSDPGPLGVDEWYEGGALLCMTSSGTTSRGRSWAIRRPQRRRHRVSRIRKVPDALVPRGLGRACSGVRHADPRSG